MKAYVLWLFMITCFHFDFFISIEFYFSVHWLWFYGNFIINFNLSYFIAPFFLPFSLWFLFRWNSFIYISILIKSVSFVNNLLTLDKCNDLSVSCSKFIDILCSMLHQTRTQIPKTIMIRRLSTILNQIDWCNMTIWTIPSSICHYFRNEPDTMKLKRESN